VEEFYPPDHHMHSSQRQSDESTAQTEMDLTTGAEGEEKKTP
jgi:hypothetical protein